MQMSVTCAELKYSSGTIAFYWSVRKTVPQLEHHTVFLTGQGEKGWDVVFRGDACLPEDPSFYVACPGEKPSNH